MVHDSIVTVTHHAGLSHASKGMIIGWRFIGVWTAQQLFLSPLDLHNTFSS